MSLLPRFRVKYGEPIGVEIFVQFPDLSDNELTYLDADCATGALSLTANGLNLNTNDYIVVGAVGSEKTEIVQVSSATATTISISATSFAHNRGDVVRFIPYNQIVVERSTNSGSTYSALSAIGIKPDSRETYLQRPTDSSTNYYKFRFYNSNTGNYSAYSSAVQATGFPSNSLGQIKLRALLDLGEQQNDLLTDEFFQQSLTEARREVDQDQRVVKWSFRFRMNKILGYCLAGNNSVAVPADLRNRNTPQNILMVRIGRNNRPIVYQDDNRWNQNYLNLAHTTLSVTANLRATELTLTSSNDFPVPVNGASSSLVLASQSSDSNYYTATYSDNDTTTGILSGVAALPNQFVAGTNVWYGANFGVPSAYTINNAVMYFDIPFSQDINGQNIYMDYYATMTELLNDGDTLDEPEYDLYVNYLKWKIKYLKSNGVLKSDDDGDFKEWMRRKDELVAKEITGQFIYISPEYYGSSRPYRI